MVPIQYSTRDSTRVLGKLTHVDHFFVSPFSLGSGKSTVAQLVRGIFFQSNEASSMSAQYDEISFLLRTLFELRILTGGALL